MLNYICSHYLLTAIYKYVLAVLFLFFMIIYQD